MQFDRRRCPALFGGSLEIKRDYFDTYGMYVKTGKIFILSSGAMSATVVLKERERNERPGRRQIEETRGLQPATLTHQ